MYFQHFRHSLLLFTFLFSSFVAKFFSCSRFLFKTKIPVYGVVSNTPLARISCLPGLDGYTYNPQSIRVGPPFFKLSLSYSLFHPYEFRDIRVRRSVLSVYEEGRATSRTQSPRESFKFSSSTQHPFFLSRSLI